VKVDNTYTIGVLKCSNNVAFSSWPNASPVVTIFDYERQGWPDTQILPDRIFVCAEDLELETAW
jgi:hypothetical protein